VHPLLTRWDRDELAARADDVLDVYAEAMEVPRAAARSRRPVLQAHLDRAGLKAVAAVDGNVVNGFAYGYIGAPGQWWFDQVCVALGSELGDRWMVDPFEVCELHVRPSHHGTGLGRALLDTLLTDVPASTAVLTTPDQETRARRFYRAGGWEDLIRGLRFPGDPRVFAVLGKRLPSS